MSGPPGTRSSTGQAAVPVTSPSVISLSKLVWGGVMNESGESEAKKTIFPTGLLGAQKPRLEPPVGDHPARVVTGCERGQSNRQQRRPNEQPHAEDRSDDARPDDLDRHDDGARSEDGTERLDAPDAPLGG